MGAPYRIGFQALLFHWWKKVKKKEVPKLHSSKICDNWDQDPFGMWVRAESGNVRHWTIIKIASLFQFCVRYGSRLGQNNNKKGSGTQLRQVSVANVSPSWIRRPDHIELFLISPKWMTFFRACGLPALIRYHTSLRMSERCDLELDLACFSLSE